MADGDAQNRIQLGTSRISGHYKFHTLVRGRRSRLVALLCILVPIYAMILIFHDWLPAGMTAYASDILCMPVILSLAAWMLDLLFPGKGALSKGQVIFATAYTAVLFEVLLPQWSNRYTADIWDAFCYFAGAFLWWMWIKPNAQNHASV